MAQDKKIHEELKLIRQMLEQFDRALQLLIHRFYYDSGSDSGKMEMPSLDIVPPPSFDRREYIG